MRQVPSGLGPTSLDGPSPERLREPCLARRRFLPFRDGGGREDPGRTRPKNGAVGIDREGVRGAFKLAPAAATSCRRVRFGPEGGVSEQSGTASVVDERDGRATAASRFQDGIAVAAKMRARVASGCGRRGSGAGVGNDLDRGGRSGAA
jgi:hypothetical protein